MTAPAQPTPGPWKVGTPEMWHGERRVPILAPFPPPLERLDCEVGFARLDEDARLIAAAPEMLAFMERIAAEAVKYDPSTLTGRTFDVTNETTVLVKCGLLREARSLLAAVRGRP